MVKKVNIDAATVERLASKYSDIEAAKLLSISTQTFYTIRKKYGILSFAERNETYERKKERKAINIEEIETLSACYTDKEAADILGISLITFNRRRREFGIKSFSERSGMRKASDGTISQYAGTRKYTFNQRYFNNIDTPTKAYLLGFMAGDGGIKKDLNTARLCLKHDDQEVIDLLKKELCHTGSIKSMTTKESKKVYLDICSKQLCQDLVSWGVTPAKSYTVDLAKPLTSDLFKFYLLGYIDANGCINKTAIEIGTASVNLVNTICAELKKLFEEPVRVSIRTTSTNKILFEIAIRKKINAPIVKWLYEEPYEGLQRKQNLARTILLSSV